jgi:predicted enzyme related to lactoylglutathione lyase
MASKKSGSVRSTRASGARSRAAKKPATRRAPPSASARPAAKPAAATKPSGAARPATAPEAPNAIGVWHHHLDYTSHDVAAIKRFYTQILGFTRFIEDPKAGYLSIRTTPTTSLGFMAPVPGPPEQWRPPGEPALYFFVTNVDRVHKELIAKGVSFQQAPTDMPWGHRMAICRDPEGRMVCLAQDPSRG